MRVVPILETLSPAEHKVLQDWLRHADLYHDGRDTTALFVRSADVRSMMPRGRVAVRLRDALQAVTGDPQVRVHHCRHGLPNRLLAAALALHQGANAHLQAALRKWCEPEALLDVLTQEAVATRRLIWAIANIMGHTPRTLLRSYWHLGGELLAMELKRAWWPDSRPVGKTLAPAELRRFALRWKPRTAEMHKLAPETYRNLTPDAVDDVLDVLRQYGRADGVAAATMVSEEHIQAVAQAAAAIAEQARGKHTERTGWWLIEKDARYEPAQIRQVREALSKLGESLTKDEDSLLRLTKLGWHVDERQNMLVTSSESEMLGYARVLGALVDDAKNVEVVLPTSTSKTVGASKESAAGSPPVRKRGRPKKGSVAGPLAVSNDVWAGWLELIEKAGYSHTRRAHLAASRDGGANRKVRQLRVGVRIRQNTTDRVRDSRIGMRVLLAAAVWSAVTVKNARRTDPAGGRDGRALLTQPDASQAAGPVDASG